METRSLRANEKRILNLLLENEDYSFKDIAGMVDLNEVSVRRIHNKLKQDGVFKTVNVPNFPLLGHRILMVQKIGVSSPFLIKTKRMIERFLAEWPNCISCHETYDGKIMVQSVWRDPEEFKQAHSAFFKTHGSDWLDEEKIDMVPLEPGYSLLRIRGFAGDVCSG